MRRRGRSTASRYAARAHLVTTEEVVPAGRQTFQRVASIVLIAGAACWGAIVVRQALQTDDGGPPLGAICSALPAFILLIAGGAVWPKRAA
jgi:hypothetical protein